MNRLDKSTIERIRNTNSLMRDFIQRRIPEFPEHTNTLNEANEISQMLKDCTTPDASICAQLRANALKANQFSPVIALYAEAIAKDLDPANI